MKATIGIDAGHGGDSYGTYTVKTVKNKLFEKDYTLELALLLEEKLIENGFKTLLTRRNDVNPGKVTKRAENMEGCDFALSIHFNGFNDEKANGTEVFVPYGEKIGYIEAGFYNELGKYFRRRSPFARSNNYYNRNETFDKKLDVETGRFMAVSDEKDYFGFVRRCWEMGISADLLEICFLTNETDFEIYEKFKDEIATGIAKSIVEGFGEKYVREKPKEIPNFHKVNNWVNLVK